MIRTCNKIISVISFCFLISIIACDDIHRKSNKDFKFEQENLLDAKEFKILKVDDYKILRIRNKSEKGFQEFKLSKNFDNKNNALNTIKVPCKKIICLSSTQLSYFFSLDSIGSILAINSSRYLRNKKMKKRIASGQVKRIGKEGHFNLEVIAALNPDVIFVSPFKVGGFDALRNLGIPLVPMAAYNEESPLGRAEWIKMIALFTGQEQKADSIFAGIKLRYEQLKELTTQINDKPTVFSGKMRSGSWYVPGGKSFYAHYFRDAGAKYIIEDSIQGAYPIDFETIYKKAANCDYWRIIHPEKKDFSLKDLAMQDSRYMDFKAFKEKKVIFCNIKEKPYYEEAAIKPDVILADYIYYFHPNLLPYYKTTFYDRLK